MASKEQNRPGYFVSDWSDFDFDEDVAKPNKKPASSGGVKIDSKSINGEDDEAEKLDIIADILGGLYGDSVLSLIDEADAGKKYWLKGEWVSDSHPRDEHGRFVAVGSEGAEKAHAMVAAVKAGKKSPASVKALTKQLSVLTVKQLKEIKDKHGFGEIKGKLKSELVAKLAEKIGQSGKKPTRPVADKPNTKKPTEGQQEGDRKLPKETTAYLDKASPEEIQAVKDYSGGASFRINAALREGAKLPANLQKVDDGMQAVFAKTPALAKPITVYRGMSMSQEGAEAFVAGLKKGEFKSKSYVSTTTNQADTADSRISMMIVANHGIDMLPVSKSGAEENEFLINRDSKFKVKSIKPKEGGGFHVEMEQVGKKKPTSGNLAIKPKQPK